MKQTFERLAARRAHALHGGGERGPVPSTGAEKLTARERIELLTDEGSFEEFGMFVEHRATEFGMEKRRVPGDGVVTGWGTVNGRAVFVSPRILPFSAARFPRRMRKKSPICRIWLSKPGTLIGF